MQLGQRHRQAIGLAICAIAFCVPAVMPRGDAAPLPALRAISAVVGSEPVTEGGSLVATVSWPAGAAERSDICVVVFGDGDGGRVVDERVGRLEPIAGKSGAGSWTAEGLPAGRYTVRAAECAPRTAGARPRVEPQFLGGADRAENASWVDVAGGDRVDVGTITLRRAGSAAPQR